MPPADVDRASSPLERESIAELADAVVFFAHGGRKRLGSFWSEQRCLLVFLRHLACPGCVELVTELSPHFGELRQLGLRVVLVATGAPSRIPPFAMRMHLDDALVDVVTDQTLSAHRAANLIRSRWAAFGPRNTYEGLRLYAKGLYVPRHPEDGDLVQQGGALVIDRGGEVLFHHVDHHLADHFSIADVCEVAAK